MSTQYPFTPELLDALPEEIAEHFRELERELLIYICEQLKKAGEMNEVSVQNIRALRSHGVDLEDIKRLIEQYTGLTSKQLDKLLNEVVERNQTYYTELIDISELTQPAYIVAAEDIEALKKQCQREFGNLTRSLGFLVDNGRTMLEPAKAYQWALDRAELEIQSGAISYNQAITNAVKQLAESGIKSVDYESGHVDQIDVAARRAVMTGVNQLCARYAEQSAEFLNTPYYEVSAHIGARDKPGVSPWASHKEWQGKVYSVRAGDIYPDIYEKCGLDEVDGLEGANCRHKRYPFVEGVSERTYTDEQLEHIDDGHDCTYDGKHYSAYEATQMQRRLERTIRKQRRLRDAYKSAGLTDDARTANIKLRRLNTKYREFSKAADLPERSERLKVLYVDNKSKATAEALKAKRAAEAARAAADEAQAFKYFEVDSGDALNSIVKRSTIKLENGFSCFPDGDPLNEYVKQVKPLKTYYDVALHGSSTAVGFGSIEVNMSPRVLAAVIRHSKGWNGQKIRLLSCSTGKKTGDEYCFAEELANALGVEVKAPNGVLFITSNGRVYIGEHREGAMISFAPNQRGRKK